MLLQKRQKMQDGTCMHVYIYTYTYQYFNLKFFFFVDQFGLDGGKTQTLKVAVLIAPANCVAFFLTVRIARTLWLGSIICTIPQVFDASFCRSHCMIDQLTKSLEKNYYNEDNELITIINRTYCMWSLPSIYACKNWEQQIYMKQIARWKENWKRIESIPEKDDATRSPNSKTTHKICLAMFLAIDHFERSRNEDITIVYGCQFIVKVGNGFVIRGKIKFGWFSSYPLHP